jgi:TetR/AcrR family transcriptional regulator, mexJK operon transcriptional repressor
LIRKVRSRSGGRSPDPTKDEAILESARACFFDDGFSATTMERVAARASVSKVTVYKRFVDKDALFEAVVRHEMAKMEHAFRSWPFRDGSLVERLNAYGSILLRFLFSTEHMLLDRMLAHDLKHSPAMARRFFDVGPGACRAQLAQILGDAAERGEIVIDDPLLAAADLFSLWKGFIDKELEFKVLQFVSGEYIDARVKRGTRLFMKMVSC